MQLNMQRGPDVNNWNESERHIHDELIQATSEEAKLYAHCVMYLLLLLLIDCITVLYTIFMNCL